MNLHKRTSIKKKIKYKTYGTVKEKNNNNKKVLFTDFQTVWDAKKGI